MVVAVFGSLVGGFPRCSPNRPSAPAARASARQEHERADQAPSTNAYEPLISAIGPKPSGVTITSAATSTPTAIATTIAVS